MLFNLIKNLFSSTNVPSITINEFLNKKNDKNIIVLDVRTENERNFGFIESSIHIALDELKEGLQKLEKYKDKQIIVYCQSGMRSMVATQLLIKNKLNAKNLDGGYKNFQRY